MTGVQVVMDAGWAFADGEQTAFVDNTNIDGTLYTYDKSSRQKDDCKDGGWMNLVNDDGDAVQEPGRLRQLHEQRQVADQHHLA